MRLGHAAPDARAADAPTMPSLDTEAVTLEDVELMQLLFEVGTDAVAQMLPPALHPTSPGVVTFLGFRCADSPWGPFALAQARIECRSGTRPRALLVSGVIDNDAAARALRERWGYRLAIGQVGLRRYYDSSELFVVRDGEAILELALRDPVLLPPEVPQFVSSIHPANTPRGFRLVQVDPTIALSRADRGDPDLGAFDGSAWGEPALEPAYPISAVVGLGTVTLPKLRFLLRPDELAFTGTEPL